MNLTKEERSILDGSQGPILQKIIQTVVRFGEAFDSDRLIDITAAPHIVMSAGAGVLVPFYEMLEEICNAGFKVPYAFTVNPRPWQKNQTGFGFLENVLAGMLFKSQRRLESLYYRLGIKDNRAYTCACYMPEVGNIPIQGDILCWAESSAVVYANSVIGARTNRNSAGMDILCNILGKVPRFGLLTDEGRKASWLINLKTEELPDPQLLGSYIGKTVNDAVPLIIGLDKYLNYMRYEECNDYLKDMGAASAAAGAVGLYHVENVTPEALENGRSLLQGGFSTCNVKQENLERMKSSYPESWDIYNKSPQLCFIGCPHLSREQVLRWIDQIIDKLDVGGRKKVSVPVYLSTSPDVIQVLQSEDKLPDNLVQRGLHIVSFCPLAVLNNPLMQRKRVVTNSGKLRNYMPVEYVISDDIIHLITG
jgi:hypothetical protein